MVKYNKQFSLCGHKIRRDTNSVKQTMQESENWEKIEEKRNKS